jgi:hypothetical protein
MQGIVDVCTAAVDVFELTHPLLLVTVNVGSGVLCNWAVNAVLPGSRDGYGGDM